MAPSSGFPTDLRRSDCLSGSHRPRTLRTRCNQHPRVEDNPRQGRRGPTLRKLRRFLFAQSATAYDRTCSGHSKDEKRVGRPVGPTARAVGSTEAPDSGGAGSAGAGAEKFAEPGTLSSTFPTNLPLPRSAPRGASTYRRPVLGAGENLGDQARPFKARPRRISPNLRRPGQPIQPWPFQYARSLPRRLSSRWSWSG